MKKLSHHQMNKFYSIVLSSKLNKKNQYFFKAEFKGCLKPPIKKIFSIQYATYLSNKILILYENPYVFGREIPKNIIILFFRCSCWQHCGGKIGNICRPISQFKLSYTILPKIVPIHLVHFQELATIYWRMIKILKPKK